MEYSNSARDYAYLVRDLSERVGSPNAIEYLKLHNETEAARVRAELARLEYERHLTEHGCFSATPESRSTKI